MTEKNNIQTEDELIRRMMKSAKTQAPENLKYRIMQQVETEKALSRQSLTPQKAKLAGNILKDFKAIFGVAYLLLFGLSIFAIVFGGKEALVSSQFILIASLVVVSSLSFWVFTRLESHLRDKRKKSSVRQ